MRIALLLWICVLAMGCADPDERPASWAYIHAAIIRPNCTSSNCHSSLGATSGLQFDSKEGAYIGLVGQLCDDEVHPGEAPRNFVVPSDPSRSKLMYQLRGIELRQMPPDLPLPPIDIELIEQWILEGALCN